MNESKPHEVHTTDVKKMWVTIAAVESEWATVYGYLPEGNLKQEVKAALTDASAERARLRAEGHEVVSG